MKIDFESKPVYGDDDKYIKTKIKIYAHSIIKDLYYFHNYLSLYLVLHLCFSDNKLSHSFFYMIKKIYKTPILPIRLELVIMLIASSLLI